MAIIAKDTKIYCNADSPISTLDGGDAKYNMPYGQEGINSRNYYGDSTGGPTQEDLVWQPGDFFGFTTGRTHIDTATKTLYYEFKMKSSYRKRNKSFLSTYVPIFILTDAVGIRLDKAGTYEDNFHNTWVSSEFVTDDAQYALNKFDKRTDNKTLTEVKKDNLGNKSGATTPKATASTGVDNPNGNSNNTILYGVIVVVLAFVAWLIWGRK